ncbi:helix-turn-helix domain-containing protein [Acidiphilium sp. C61]|uniref:helix-turn-helix domain-containing protein n=1 Tax=Acidiphilium sp. C61 TaxID=1671485 RepID=UPI00157B8E6B|nr:helix-turn-helix domain-containing protein [Acidiphilium sp. C61]
MINDARIFGELVQARRKSLGLTQRQLALAINSGERFIVDLEAGKATCQLGKALAAASAVGIELVDAGSPAAAPELGEEEFDIPEVGL